MWGKQPPGGKKTGNSLLDFFDDAMTMPTKKTQQPEGIGTLPMGMVYDARCDMSPHQSISELEEEVFEYERVRLVIRSDMSQSVPSYCYLHHRRVAGSMKVGDFLAHRMNVLGVSLDTIWVLLGTGEIIPPRDKRLQLLSVNQIRRSYK
ncbi:hypothetical protein BIZ83_gp217 [Erwinia phage vB_EamM_ChrisDB]|uniref:hypothetical protein n=1 Tax=Erwinia phage vB_EamM_ChrisDB TaxID=1883371 RepID=UPI00081CFA9B|nr:hypothetical protein BIZ83_gp217 [Erwinia phage vB_EamM_ChrisDB]ANZ48636.1 hypothetical protein CHRISDB_74 [Erwinia phage vB_EamM_ChrisDB]